MPVGSEERHHQQIEAVTRSTAAIVARHEVRAQELIDGLAGEGPLVTNARLTSDIQTEVDGDMRFMYQDMDLYGAEHEAFRAQWEQLCDSESALGAVFPPDAEVTISGEETASFQELARHGLNVTAEAYIRFALHNAASPVEHVRQIPLVAGILTGVQKAGLDQEALEVALDEAYRTTGDLQRLAPPLAPVLAEVVQKDDIREFTYGVTRLPPGTYEWADADIQRSFGAATDDAVVTLSAVRRDSPDRPSTHRGDPDDPDGPVPGGVQPPPVPGRGPARPGAAKDTPIEDAPAARQTGSPRAPQPDESPNDPSARGSGAQHESSSELEDALVERVESETQHIARDQEKAAQRDAAGETAGAWTGVRQTWGAGDLAGADPDVSADLLGSAEAPDLRSSAELAPGDATIPTVADNRDVVDRTSRGAAGDSLRL